MTGPLSFSGLIRRSLALAALSVLAACTSHVSPPAPLSRSDQQCLADLDRLGVQYQVEPQSASTSRTCLIQNPVRVSAATVPFSRPTVAACGLAVKFDQFEREVIRPLAKRSFGRDLKTVVDIGAYSCRSTRAGRESEHAHGLAMDIAGFELSDGTMISVKEEWTKRGKGRDFLHAVATQACRYFNEVLDPDSDRDHADHIHLDLGRYKYCIHRSNPAWAWRRHSAINEILALDEAFDHAIPLVASNLAKHVVNIGPCLTIEIRDADVALVRRLPCIFGDDCQYLRKDLVGHSCRHQQIGSSGRYALRESPQAEADVRGRRGGV